MKLYIEYVLACSKANAKPMPKQAWMQLGMPALPTDPDHVWYAKAEGNTK